MSIEQRFKEFYKIVRHTATEGQASDTGRVSQAAATLVLAEIIQGTTHSVDLSGDVRKPVYVTQR
jgi:hypothetical protein